MTNIVAVSLRMEGKEIENPNCVGIWCREGESNPQDPKVGGF